MPWPPPSAPHRNTWPPNGPNTSCSSTSSAIRCCGCIAPADHSTVAATAAAGESLSVAGNSPVDGRATVELVVPRDRLTFQPPPRDACPQTSAGLAELQETYARANDHRLASVEVPVREGHFTAEMKIPGRRGRALPYLRGGRGGRGFRPGFGGGEIVPPSEGSGKAIEVSLSLRERVGVRGRWRGPGRLIGWQRFADEIRIKRCGSLRPDGGIGRHARLRILSRKGWEFESPLGHLFTRQ